MSTAAATHSRSVPAPLRPENITLPAEAGTKGVILMAVGFLVILAGIGVLSRGFGNGTAVQGLASFHAGACGVLAICLGALIFLMIFNVLNAGWIATLRRQVENIAWFLPFAWVLAYLTPIVDYFQGGHLFTWMNPSNYVDHLLEAKFVYFFGHAAGEADHHASLENHSVFPLFFVIRGVFYLGLWTYLSRRLCGLSLRQDRDPDVDLAAQARSTSAWGIPVLSLSIAFAAFDLLKSLDYRFFSTMWGVYYFAGGCFGMFFLLAIIGARLRAKGKLVGAVTEEHFHDLGKMMFVFTVFWGYIAFSQYFLIWYSNVPEETTYFIFRKEGVWNTFSIIQCFGHFLLPFFFIISRHVKRNMKLMTIVGFYGLAIHAIDMYWIVRPMAHNSVSEAEVSPMARLLDFIIMAGVFLIFGGFLVKRMTAVPLVAVNDPYMPEALHHRNYV